MEENNILNTNFDDLEIKDNILRGIYSYGFEYPSNIQYKSIPIINKKKDLIAQAQSGTGKTGSFLIGLLNNIDETMNETQGIIICPTHELAIQCSEVCKELMKYTEFKLSLLIGKTSVKKCIDELRNMPHIIIGTPGRILDMINRKELFTSHIKMMVLDEADDILSSGFIDNISSIISYLPKESQICIFSATIPEEIKEITTKFMNNPERLLINREDLTLEGINQFYILLDHNNWKIDILNDLYDTLNITQSIIYVNSKRTLKYLKEKLDENSFPTSYIHGDMTADERKMNMEEFKSGKSRIMLSTDLLARGIDIQQLSLVINFDLPSNKETYIHRIGRSGRYGRKGVAINFVLKDEIDEKSELEKFYDIKIPEMPENIKDYLSV